MSPHKLTAALMLTMFLSYVGLIIFGVCFPHRIVFGFCFDTTRDVFITMSLMFGFLASAVTVSVMSLRVLNGDIAW